MIDRLTERVHPLSPAEPTGSIPYARRGGLLTLGIRTGLSLCGRVRLGRKGGVNGVRSQVDIACAVIATDFMYSRCKGEKIGIRR